MSIPNIFVKTRDIPTEMDGAVRATNIASMLDVQIQESVRFITSQCDRTPRVAIVLGSGLGCIAEHIDEATSIPYRTIPHFPSASAEGHAGNLVIGTLEGVPVVAMQGRVHLYEGHSVDAAIYPVRVMHALGASTLIASNASGGLNPRFKSGDVVLIDEHIDLMFRPRACATSKGLNPYCGMPDRRGASIYDSHLMQLAETIGLKIGHPLYRGTYGATLGPNYETRAEYRFFRQIGADMVGMSTVPETMTASELGMNVLAFSVITNVAAPDRVTSTNHEEVLSWAHRAQEKLVPITRHLMRTVLLVDGSRNNIEPGSKSST